MKYLLSLILILTLPVLCLAPCSEFSKTLSLIYSDCEKYKVNPDWVLIIFRDESTRLKNITVCEPLYIRRYQKCVKAYGVSQILLRTAREMGYKGPEKELEKKEINIETGIKFIHLLCGAYNGDMAKVISHYKTGKPYHSKYYRRLYLKYLKLKGAK
jgi:soluble lytic murein transglycosylase-like protein